MEKVFVFLGFLPFILAINAQDEQNFQLPSSEIGAFNIQIFGAKKYNEEKTREYLVKILGNFDICLIQEIRDSEGEAIINLLQDVNEATGKQYEMALSERLGRTNSKEQYAYFYDSSKFALESTHQYPADLDEFERPPFGAVFTSNQTAISRFALAGIHTKPSDAPGEIARLEKVYDKFTQEMNTEDIIIMGDFNADCSYTTRSDWQSIAIRTDTRFDWLLGEDVDTTAGNSDCAYDRFIVGGAAMRAAIVANSSSVIRFDQQYELTTAEALEISDHYPIAARLHGKLSSYILSNTELSQAVILEGPIDASSVDDIINMITDNLGFAVEKIRNGWRYALVALTKEGVTDVVKELLSVQAAYPTIMKDELISMVKTSIKSMKTLDDVPNFPGNVVIPEAKFSLRLEYWKQGVKIIVKRYIKSLQ